MNKPAILGVTGSPVFHSLSPDLFSMFSRETGMKLNHLRMFSESAGDSVRLMREIPFSGINITTPFKTDIIDHLDHLDVHARNIGAVNLVKNENDVLRGYNTDHVGVVRSLKNYRFNISGKKVLVLGAGGAGRAAVYGLKMNGARIFLFNRDEDKGSRIADQLGAQFTGMRELSEMIVGTDLIIDTLPDDAASGLLKKCRMLPPVFKADYSRLASNPDRRIHGLTSPDGIDWLFFQGEESYRLLFSSAIFFHDNCHTGFRKMIEESRECPESVFLVGFTGCGKSHTGRALSRRTGFEFIDLDAEVEKKTEMTINELFKLKGEKEFRKIESEQLRRISGKSKVICSCGGGVVMDPGNRKILKDLNTVWVHTNPNEILKRIDRSSRPVLSGISREEMKDLFDERTILYSEVSKALVSNSGRPEYAAEKIYHEVFQKSFGQG